MVGRAAAKSNSKIFGCSPPSCGSGGRGRIIAVRQDMVPVASGTASTICEAPAWAQPRTEQEWLDGHSPADDWDAHVTKRVLDELFSFARQYRSSKSFDGLLKFIAGFRLYSPYQRHARPHPDAGADTSPPPTVGAGSMGERSRSMPNPSSSCSRWVR